MIWDNDGAGEEYKQSITDHQDFVMVWYQHNY